MGCCIQQFICSKIVRKTFSSSGRQVLLGQSPTCKLLILVSYLIAVITVSALQWLLVMQAILSVMNVSWNLHLSADIPWKLATLKHGMADNCPKSWKTEWWKITPNLKWFSQILLDGMAMKESNISKTRCIRTNDRDLQIRLRLRVRLFSARGLGLSCRRHCCCRRQLATKIFQ